MITKIEMQAMDAVIGIYREMTKGNEPNWEQRRYEVAKDILCAILGNPNLINGISEGESDNGKDKAYARMAVDLADTLIAELKTEK